MTYRLMWIHIARFCILAAVCLVSQGIGFAAPGNPGAAAALPGDLAGKLAGQGMLLRLVWLYGLGVMLAFTPCVYPMIPVTLGYFSGQQGYRGRGVIVPALLYVLGMALTYSLIGTAAALAGGFIGAAMQSAAVKIGLSALLVALALSMFGLFELTVPTFVMSKSTARGGAIGALVMGLVFGLAAGPCVGPVVVGLFTFVAQTGSPVVGFLSFLFLGLGLGTPLFVLAVFAAKLPAPGAWMVTVKRVAGFMLLGAAAYFVLSLLPADVRRYPIPIVMFVGAFYLIALDKVVNATLRGQTVGILLGVAVAVSAVFMLSASSEHSSMPLKGTAVPAHPNTLTWSQYSAAALAEASKVGKPVIVDFYADWCGVCQELENGAFRDPAVIAAAQRFVRLRVDGTNRDDKGMLDATRNYQIIGFPTILFFDSSGKQVSSARIVGFIDASDLVATLELVSPSPHH